MLRQGHFYVPAQPVLVNSSQSVQTSEKGTPTLTDSDLADFVTRTTYDDVSDTARIQLKCPRSAHSGEVVRVPLATDRLCLLNRGAFEFRTWPGSPVCGIEADSQLGRVEPRADNLWSSTTDGYYSEDTQGRR